MHEHLFDHIDIPSANIHIPDGTLPSTKFGAFCEEYRKGHSRRRRASISRFWASAAPATSASTSPARAAIRRTRLITLDNVTRLDAASDFFGEQYVPRRAITMGVGTILAAKRVILMAFGEGKAADRRRGRRRPAHRFRRRQLSCRSIPTPRSFSTKPPPPSSRAVKLPGSSARSPGTEAPSAKPPSGSPAAPKRPILKLTDEDYNEGGLQDLLAAHGPAYDINIDVFRSLAETITGWPGGKPVDRKRPGDIDRPADAIFPKRVLIFSPASR